MAGGYNKDNIDEEIATNLQQEEDEQAHNIVESEESEEGDDTEDEEVILLTQEMMDKLSLNRDVPDSMKETLLNCSDPAIIQGMIDNITNLIATENDKLVVAKASKKKLEKLISDSKKPKAVKGGESEKSKAGKQIYTVCVVFEGVKYEVNVRGRATFKSIREALLTLYPNIFKSHDFMKHKLLFQIEGKSKSLNEKGRGELLGWGASSGGTLTINVSNVASTAAGSSSSASSKAKAKSEPKKSSKDKKDKKPDEQ